MKILQVNTEKTWRGGERQTLWTVEGLLKKNIDCELMTLKNSLLYHKAIKANINVIAVKDSLDTLKKLSKLKNKFDIIHTQTGKTHTHSVLTKPFHRTPVIYTKRVNFASKGFLTKLKYKYTDKIISISNAISLTLNQSNMCHDSDSLVISDAIKSKNLDRIKTLALKKHLGINNNIKIIGIVAAIEACKDPIAGVNAIKELWKIRQDFIVLHFGEGKMFADIADAIKGTKIEKSYIQMGYKDNATDYFSIMDVFLMTSKEEGLGSSVLDAFSCSVGVVSTNAGGLKELVESRGYLCHIGDSKCLAEGISSVLNHKEESIEYIKNAKKYCENELSIELIADKYIDVYKKVLLPQY